MKKFTLLLGCISGVLAVATPAFALPRVFVSGLGNNSNPGTRSSPVRSLAKAMILVDPKGEIIILDSANYAPVTINKPVTIAATGVEAEIEVPAFQDGISIDVGPSDAVTLRGLTINGGGVGISFSRQKRFTWKIA